MKLEYCTSAISKEIHFLTSSKAKVSKKERIGKRASGRNGDFDQSVRKTDARRPRPRAVRFASALEIAYGIATSTGPNSSAAPG